MKKINNLLIEIGLEELPYTQINDILKKVKNTFHNNFKKKFKFFKIKSFVTIRRISLIVEKITILNQEKDKEDILIIINNSINDLKLKTKMRWNKNEKAFIRPIKWYVLLLNKNLIKHSLFNVKSQKETFGHKLIKNKIEVDAETYEINLKKIGHVICDYIKRKILIKSLIKSLIRKNKLNLVIKKNTLTNISNLIEYPLLIICSFKKEYLHIPEYIIITTLLKNQFCILLKKNNKLINKIIIIIDSFYKKKSIISRYEYIINTKLSEIQYLYQKEKNYLSQKNVYDLKSLILNEKNGNMFDKTIRIKNIAKYLINKLNLKSKKIIKAAKLIKMDYLTKINNEMPELTGLICSYNIKNDNTISRYLYYYNRILNNKIIKNLNSSVIFISDKIENIVSFFLIKMRPSGSKDPFNLKKEAKLIVNLIIKNEININVLNLIEHAITENKINNNLKLKTDIFDFIFQKLEIKKEHIKLLKNRENIYLCNKINNVIENFVKYKFKNSFLKTLKRIVKITNKNKINLTNKLKKNLIHKKEEKILLLEIIKKIKIINILNKNSLFFESNKTLIMMENKINSYFNSVLIIDKNEKIMINRLKLLNIIKRLLLLKINWNNANII